MHLYRFFAQRQNHNNYLIILSDLVKVGVKGYCFAKDISKPDYFSNINEMIAGEPDETLVPVWLEVFEVFKEHMGINLPKDTTKKKAVKNIKKATV